MHSLSYVKLIRREEGHMSAVSDLVNQIASQGDAIERLGHLPDALAGMLKQQSAFTLLLPEVAGGPQTPYPAFLKMVEDIAEADGSVGWCVNQGSVLSSLALLLPAATQKTIWPSPDRVIANGPPAGPCTLEPVQDGFLLSGQWSFSSGCHHASYLVGFATIRDSREVRWCFFPREAAEIDETWAVNGLKGTGSYSFSTDNLFVPEDFTLSYQAQSQGVSNYQIPLNLLFAGGFAAVALGVSRAALNFAITRCQHKVKRFDRETLAANAAVQMQIGETEAQWQSASRYLHSTVAEIYSFLEAGNSLTEAQKISLRGAGTHVIRQCAQITDSAYNLCSTDSIFTNNDIHRRFQDMHVISQHLQARPDNYGLVGRYLLDVPYDKTML